MAVARKHKPGTTPPNPHRSWRDTGGNVVVACRAADESSLMRVASTADRIMLRAAPGRQADQRTVAQIVDALGAVRLLTSQNVQHPEAILRRLRLALGERLARLRLVGGFHFLSGTFEQVSAEGSETVLLLVPASQQVDSCDWYLTL
jgi:hypothetical protein